MPLLQLMNHTHGKHSTDAQICYISYQLLEDTVLYEWRGEIVWKHGGSALNEQHINHEKYGALFQGSQGYASIELGAPEIIEVWSEGHWREKVVS